MKKISLILLILISAIDLFGTEQFPDIIIIEGVEYELYDYPLEEIFKKYPEKRQITNVTCTALWRGYIATYELINNVLYLKEIEIKYIDSAKNEISKRQNYLKILFPEKDSIKVDWYTGILRISNGKEICYNEKKRLFFYERFFIFEIQNGVLTNSKELDYVSINEFIEKQFQEFIKSNDYLIVYEEYEKKYKSKRKINGLIKLLILDYIKEIY